MKKKGIIIALVLLIGVLSLIIIGTGMKISKQKATIRKLQAIDNAKLTYSQNINEKNSENIPNESFDYVNQKVFNQDFNYLNGEIFKDDNNGETITLNYKLAKEGSKEVTLKNIKLNLKNNKWQVTDNKNLSKEQVALVNNIANKYRENVKKIMIEENKEFNQMQNEVNNQFKQMNKQFNSLIGN